MGKVGNVINVPIGDIKPYDRNAKQHSRDQVDRIVKSIEEFGFLSPCLIDKDYNLIAGHGRIMAAEKLSMDTVPCLMVEGLTDEQRKAYILADNKLTELGEWDMSAVIEELTELDMSGFDISLTGFDFDLDDEEPEVEEDDYSEDVETRCQEGDVWQLGRHKLMCGDSTDITSVEKLVGGGDD